MKQNKQMTPSLVLKDTESISSLHAAKLLSFSSEVGLNKAFCSWTRRNSDECVVQCVSRCLDVMLGRYASHQVIAGMLSFES